METFSKLRPPDAVRIKVKIIEPTTAAVAGPGITIASTEQTKNDSKSFYLSSSCANLVAAVQDPSISNKSSPQTAAQQYRIVETKKFCVDPQITSFDILYNLIAQAFNIKW